MSMLQKTSSIIPSNSSHKYESTYVSSNGSNESRQYLRLPADVRQRVQRLYGSIMKHGVHSTCSMSSAGFRYTGSGDTARCDHCSLEVSDWTIDMKPLQIHTEKKPNCSFIQSLKSSLTSISPSSSLLTTNVRNTSISEELENPSKRQKPETNDWKSLSSSFFETTAIQQARRRTFSHWPDRAHLFIEQMITAGFFHCNVDDRTICLYCNLICEQWIPHTDDPCEVHKIFSSNCVYVRSKLTHPEPLDTHLPSLSNNPTSLQSDEILSTTAHNPNYVATLERQESFVLWPDENSPSIDHLVGAGFFYTGAKTIVTCFYCNGSISNWHTNDNPLTEHARRFSYCAFAKDLCGDSLYHRIQESKRAEQKHTTANEIRGNAASGQTPEANLTTDDRQQSMFDTNTLSTLVDARLDLPISQRLLNENFPRSIVKQCWEDQLRLKYDDFTTEDDIYLTCLILRKQRDYIDGKMENIVVPSVQMQRIRETNEASNIVQPLTTTTNDQNQLSTSTRSNLCILCLKNEKRLACTPCGHLVACVPCGGSLRSCPTCHQISERFFSIYI